jgi:hypothetical protein
VELEDLKTAWKELERRLEARDEAVLARERLLRSRSALRLVGWGQAFQIVLWLVLVAVSASFWVAHWRTLHLLWAGLLMHLYGVITIGLSVRQLFLLAAVDHTAPVVELQRKLADLRRERIRTELFLGLPWWYLWVAAAMMGAKLLLGVDLYAVAPAWIHLTLAVGVVAMVLTFWIPRRLARTPLGSRFLRAVLDDLAGPSLLRAEREVEAIARFAREEGAGA